MSDRFKCDVCGRFIGHDDFETGAYRRMAYPDSDFSQESYVTLCRTHSPHIYPKNMEQPDRFYENGIGTMIPLADVQHIEGRANGTCIIVMKTSTWCNEVDDYNNGVYLNADQAVAFKAAWLQYRATLNA